MNICKSRIQKQIADNSEHKFKSIFLSYLDYSDTIQLAKSCQFFKKLIGKNDFFIKIKLFKKDYLAIEKSKQDETKGIEKSKTKEKFTNISETSVYSYLDYISHDSKKFKPIRKALKINQNEEILLLSHLIKKEFISNKTLNFLNLNFSSLELNSIGVNILIISLNQIYSLKNIDFSNYNLSEKFIFQSNFFNLIKTNKELKDISLNNCYINDKLMKKILQSLLKSNSITDLSLKSNEISKTILDTKVLKIFISSNPITNLNLSNNILGSKGLERLVDLILSNQNINTKLSLLDISYNGLCKESGKILEKLLTSNNSLKILNLDGNYFEDGLIYIASGMKANKSINKLSLNNNNLKDKGIDYIADVLNINSFLEILEINNNLITDKGILSLSESMKIKTNLKVLYLANNSFNLLGVKYISGLTSSNSTLKELNLENNKLGIESVQLEITKENNKSLSQSKYTNNTSHKSSSNIKKDSNNEPSSEGLLQLGKIIKSNKSLISLNLSNTNLKYSISGVFEALNGNQNLKILYLSSNYLDSTYSAILANSIKSNQVISILKLDYNNLDDEFCLKLSEGLKFNKSLTILDLSYNIKISSTGALAIKNSTSGNSNLVELNFIGNKEINSKTLYMIEDALKVNKNLIAIK